MMISCRADLLDRIKSIGEAKITFTFGYDEFADGSTKHFIVSDSAGGWDWLNSNPKFKAEVESIMQSLGFEMTNYGALKKYLPRSNDYGQFLEGFFSQEGALNRFKEKGFFAASIVDANRNSENMQIELTVSKGDLTPKQADVLEMVTVRKIYYKLLAFEGKNKKHYGKDKRTWDGIFDALPTLLDVDGDTVDLSQKMEIYRALDKIGYHTMSWKITDDSIIISIMKNRPSGDKYFGIGMKKADILERIQSKGVVDLIFERGYQLHKGRGSETFTYDCRNGNDIGAPMVPPINGTVDDNGKLLGSEYTKMVSQLWAWGYEVKLIEYSDDGQRITFKVKKK